MSARLTDAPQTRYLAQCIEEMGTAEDQLSLAETLAELDSPQAWRMVAVAFVAMFTVYGIAYSFGAFFKPMAIEFGAGPSATSGVFSITVFLWSMLGWPSGHLADR